jgi:hypothetical protein
MNLSCILSSLSYSKSSANYLSLSGYYKESWDLKSHLFILIEHIFKLFYTLLGICLWFRRDRREWAPAFPFTISPVERSLPLFRCPGTREGLYGICCERANAGQAREARLWVCWVWMDRIHLIYFTFNLRNLE